MLMVADVRGVGVKNGRESADVVYGRTLSFKNEAKMVFNDIQSLKKGYTSLLNRPYETINLEERFSGIQHAALALTCWDQFNED